MTEISGTFSGSVNWQTTVGMPDDPNHALSLAEISGPQRSDDPLWANVTINYWGTTDLVGGNGTQSGYWVNEHAEGDKDWGTFQGRITTSGDQVTMEGTWEYTGGTGRFEQIRGNGTYKGQLPSPGQVENTWQGQYEL